MEKNRRRQLANATLTYLVLYGNKKLTRAGMVAELALLANNEEELDYIRNVIAIETQCKTRFNTLDDGVIIKFKEEIPECCAMCKSSDVKYKSYGDGDVFEMMSADIKCIKTNNLVVKGADANEMYLLDIPETCPKLSLRN